MARILVIGSGGREHALCWRLGTEGHDVHVAPGSAAMTREAHLHEVGVGDAEGLVGLATSLQVELAVVGPEQPLVDGLADRLRAAGVPTVGPSARAAALEGSKAEAKAFMERYAIPTARHVTVRSVDEIEAALAQFDAPPVVKADGLAAGKGVTVAETMQDAEAAARACLADARFGAAGDCVVFEERLHGQEASLFVLTDGTNAATFLPAQDHKRIGDGDTGPNTGGMGAYAPAPIYTAAVHERTMTRIVEPTLAGLREEDRPFCGVLFVGLMIDAQGDPQVIEYNCRFGDPEVQPLLLGLRADLYPRLAAAAAGHLAAERLDGDPAATIVLASAGYPASSRKGDPIEGIEDAERLDGVAVFHAGTRRTADGGWETAGGRVLGVCAHAESLGAALHRAYEAADRISFPGMQRRSDIGARAKAML